MLFRSWKTARSEFMIFFINVAMISEHLRLSLGYLVIAPRAYVRKDETSFEKIVGL